MLRVDEVAFNKAAMALVEAVGQWVDTLEMDEYNNILDAYHDCQIILNRARARGKTIV